MSVPLMFGFDNLPLRSNMFNTHMKAEGFDQLDLGSVVTQWGTTKILGRTWLTAYQQYYAPNGSQVSRGATLFNRSVGEMFGNPANLTKGVFGVRVFVETEYINRFIIGGQGGQMFTLGGQAVDSGMKNILTAGEHFLEYEIDFVNWTVKSYYDATLIGTFQSTVAFTAAAVMYFGINGIGVQSLPTAPILSYNDLYFTHDNQDGDVSGRLGPVKVLPLQVDKSTRPAGWGYADTDAFHSFTDYDQDATNGQFNGHCLIPRFTTETELAGQFKWDSVPASTSPTTYQRFNPPGGAGDSWATPVAATRILMNVTFERAKKAAAYGLAGYSTGYGAFDDWTFEGSADGQAWTVLDTRVGAAAKLIPGGKAYAFKIDPAKVGSYRYYRLNVSKVSIAAQQAGRTYMAVFQILGTAEDAILNGLLDGLNRSPNNSQTDMDLPVVRTAIDGSEASFGFKVPAVGTSQILAVRMGLSGRREQGSSEHLRARLKVGETLTPERVFELKAHVDHHDLFPAATKAPDGTAWTKESLENLQVVIKSKSGAK